MADIERMKGERTSTTPAPVSSPISLLREDIDRAFDRMFSGWPGFGSLFPRDVFGTDDIGSYGGALAPRVDVSEDENAYEITAEMPGVDEKNVSLTVKENMLTLRGEKKVEKEEHKKGYHMRERRYGSFERSFRLPDGVDADQIGASFDNGVLHVTLPKRPEAKAKERKVEIRKR